MEYWFDEAAAEAAVSFFADHLRYTSGEWAGKPFVLSDWQADLVRTVFGWKREDGTRRYRQVWLEVPRKNGKTELAAGLALLGLLADGEMSAEVYSLAVEKEQASICFKKAGLMVGYSPVLSEALDVYKTSIYCPDLVGSYKPLSSEASSKHGLSPSFVVGDEVHEWPNRDLYDVMHTGVGARRQPLEIYITTAGVYGRGFGWEMHDYALKVRDGIIEDEAFLPVIFAADQEDDWTDPAVWAKANPNLGVSVKRDYIAAECEKAKESPARENTFRRLHLNQWTEQATRWLPMDAWDAGAAGTDWKTLRDLLRGRECFAGLDLSTTTDVTALALLFPPEQDGDPWFVLPEFWVPGARIDLRVTRDRVPYDQWTAAGAMHKTDGNVVDYRFIQHRIMALAELYRIREIAFDRWNSNMLVNELMEEGLAMVAFGQGYGSMATPTRELEGLVIGRNIIHGGHPVLRWMASNVAVTMDPAGNMKPAKDKSTERIDGIVATIMALGRAVVDEVEPVGFTAQHGVVAL